ncbi:hypothetical protein ACFL2T_05500, partial [Elusimicrobiota bacterium]
HYTLSLSILDPFERVLRDGNLALRSVENLPSHFKGSEYMFQVPQGPGEQRNGLDHDAPESREIEVLETSGGFFALLPSDPALMARFEEAARDPASYPDRTVPLIRRRRAELTRTPMMDGSVIHTLRLLRADAARSRQWRSTVALVYRFRDPAPDPEGRRTPGPTDVRWPGGARGLTAVFLYKTLGGEGRVAAGIERLRERHGPDVLVLNRGEIFVYGASVTTGTLAGHRFERMGVRAAVVGSGEMVRLQDVFAYLATRSEGEGIEFLSANLVYSSAPAQTALPPFRVFEIAGKRVAVLGLTNPNRRSFLATAYMGRFALTDPIEAARKLVPELRRSADVVVALSNLTPAANARLRREVKGLDLIMGDSFPFDTDTALGAVTAEDPERRDFDEALLVTGDWPTVLTHVELRHRGLPGGRYALSAREEHLLLDERLPDAEGYAKFKPERYGVTVDTRPPVLPAARRLYGGWESRIGYARLRDRDFWSVAASLAADNTGSEASFLPVFPIYQMSTGDFSERAVREWFPPEERISVFELPGSDLKTLIKEVRRQEQPGAKVPGGDLKITVGGVGAGEKIHGVGVDARSMYRVLATDRLLARKQQFPEFARARNLRPVGSLSGLVLGELRRHADANLPVEDYRRLVSGRPLRETGLWTVNFRDVSVNVSNTKVVSDPAFADVPNARVRGFDELLIGGVSKIDVEYNRGPFKWLSATEVLYSRSRLSPPNQLPIVNTPNNRTSYLTGGTVRVAGFPWHRVARSVGPGFGAHYEGNVERLPWQRRKHVISLYPGIEFYDGSWISSIELSGNLRRDFTPLIPVNHYGLRARALVSSPLGPGRLQGEFLTNYFIRTTNDTTQDLRLELNAVAKFHLPVWKHLTLAPFVNYYYYILKVRSVDGYSLITGVSLNFSRLWKPQYESL